MYRSSDGVFLITLMLSDFFPRGYQLTEEFAHLTFCCLPTSRRILWVTLELMKMFQAGGVCLILKKSTVF